MTLFGSLIKKTGLLRLIIVASQAFFNLIKKVSITLTTRAESISTLKGQKKCTPYPVKIPML